MSSSESGYFTAVINRHAGRPTASDGALMQRLTELTRTTFPRCQLRWAGSQHKATALRDSDLDICIDTGDPVTEAQRRVLRTALEQGLGRLALERQEPEQPLARRRA